MIISALKTLTWATVALAIVSAGLQAGVGSAPRADAAPGEAPAYTSGSPSGDAAGARRARPVRGAGVAAPAAPR